MSIMGPQSELGVCNNYILELNRFMPINESKREGGNRPGTRIEYSMEEKGYESDKDQLKMLVAETKWTVGVWELMD